MWDRALFEVSDIECKSAKLCRVAGGDVLTSNQVEGGSSEACAGWQEGLSWGGCHHAKKGAKRHGALACTEGAGLCGLSALVEGAGERARTGGHEKLWGLGG